MKYEKLSPLLDAIYLCVIIGMVLGGFYLLNMMANAVDKLIGV